MKRLHYSGNVVREAVGRIVGPTTYGERLIIATADYDGESDTTTAYLLPAPKPPFPGKP